jgi:hypothetical protein
MHSNSNTALSIASASIALSVESLSDADLLAGTRRIVGRSNQLLAELLAHLAEVEARGIHRTRACSSLYAYCIYELRFSEDEAFRRVAAARLVRRFPALLDALASGELHLTGLLLLGPHLTEQNLVGVLARAKHRTKREITKLVRILDPLPAVPARIEPLGPAPARVVPSTPTWEEFIEATCPVRELAEGDRPRDWVGTENELAYTEEQEQPDAGTSVSTESAVEGPRLARRERHKVQFTATDEYVRLVDEAKALLSHAVPNATLDDIQLRAMRAFVAELKKRKYAAITPLPPDVAPPAEHPHSPDGHERPRSPDGREHPRQRGYKRHIPASVRRVVAMRDDERCTYVDNAGRRCAETHCLEFHHLTPFARGGEHKLSNLTLRCRAHNAMAAEEDFGRERMERKRTATHEASSRQG